jgi:hypothetical protein
LPAHYLSERSSCFGGKAVAARPLLLPYPRNYVRRLFLRFSAFGGSATAFLAFKVSAQKGMF